MIISIIRTLLLYIFIVFAVRLMGKRQISDLQTTELVVTLLISDIAAIPMQNTAQPLLSGLIPIMILIFCEIIASALMLKNGKFRKAICGSPVVIIDNGTVIQKQMKQLRLTIEDLCIQLRQQNISSISDVQYCIMETNGDLSVLVKPQMRTPTNQDLGISLPDKGIETVIISDGEYLEHSMSLCNIDRKWTDKILAQNNLNVKNVFIMTVNNAKEYNIIRKDTDR